MKPVIAVLLPLAFACSQPSPTAPADSGGAAPSTPVVQGSAFDPPGPEVLPDADPCVDVLVGGLRINELLAANLSGLTDAAGDTVDWVELINRDEAALDMSGWQLEDGDGKTWDLPAESLAPGALLLVIADGDEGEGEDAGELHASFSIAADDPWLGLRAPQGCRADEAASERLYGDISFGRPASDPESWGYFLEPTPGAPNSTESRPGFAATPTLSPESGFYAGGVEVSASSTDADPTIRLSLNGSEPDEESGLYKAPITPDLSAQPVVVRARAWVDGLWPSRVATATYGQDPAVLETGLWVVSLAVDPDDLWDDETGIYAYGDSFEPYYPYFGANFWEDWEKRVHVQIWDPSGALVLDQDAGIAIHGGYTRAFAQKSLRLYARSAYGPGEFTGRFFRYEDADTWQTLVLQLPMDWCSTSILEPFIDEVFRDSDGQRYDSIDIAAWAPTQVWLNGAYWGYYNLRERLDEDYVAHHHPDEDPEDLDRMELGWTHAPHWQLEQGSWDNFYAFNEFVAGADLSDEEDWATFKSLVDIDSLATTVLAEAYAGNSDWWYNNLRLWRPRRDEGRWRWMVYDLGHGWVSSTYDQFGTSVDWTGLGLPISAALENDEFRTLLANQASEFLSTSLSGDEAVARLSAMAEWVRPAMGPQNERWCGATEATWDTSVATALAFAAARGEVLRNQVGYHLGLRGSTGLTLEADPPEGGTFKLTAITVTPPFEGTFYLGVPITVTALPAEGYAFAGWEDEALGEAETAVFELSRETTVVARFVAAR